MKYIIGPDPPLNHSPLCPAVSSVLTKGEVALTCPPLVGIKKGVTVLNSVTPSVLRKSQCRLVHSALGIYLDIAWALLMAYTNCYGVT